jgi:2-iminobutanoate/2-iminopropanoate deaminase
MPRKEFSAEGTTTLGPYSRAVESEGIIYFSGQTPVDQSTGKLVNDNIKDQTNQCFQNLFATLKSTGLTEKDIVKVNVYITDMKNFTAMNEVYKDKFTLPYPARTTIGVKELPLNALIEIEMIAIRKK